LSDEIRRAASRRLLQTRSLVEIQELGASLGRPPEAIRAALQELNQRGRIPLDGQGSVIGAAGLSVRPDRHQIELGRRRG
jgi:predicted ArsR family transcriptional regulator